MVENCPVCNMDLSGLQRDTEYCPYCGAKLEFGPWDELFDEEKQREILRNEREQMEQLERNILWFAHIVGLNVILPIVAWLLYSISLYHWLGTVLAVGLVVTVILLDLLILYMHAWQG